MKPCPCCQQPTLHSFAQESMVPGKLPARLYVECQNRECATWGQTVSPDEHAELCAKAKPVVTS